MRKLIIVLSCCIVLLLLGYTSYRGYQIWKQRHGMTMAQEYFAKGDQRSAMLFLQQVLHVNPRNIEASREMANLTQLSRSPNALVWRQRVVELDPTSSKDRLALVQAAIVFHDYSIATNSLTGMSDADKNTAAYQDIAGTVALMGGQLDEAEAHFSEAIRLDPSNQTSELNLSVVRLHRTNTLDMAEARIALQRVILNSTNVTVVSQARRELVNDALRFNDMSTALAISQDMVNGANVLFADKLLRLDVLQKSKSPEFKSALSADKGEAATNSEELYDLTNWQMDRLSVTETYHWLKSLPIQTQTNQPAAILIAQCQLGLRAWHEMETSLESQNWTGLEFMRHALIARSLREQDLTEASTAEWNVAVKSTNGQKSGLSALFRLAASWKWDKEGEQVLWTVVKQYPEEKWAAPVLTQALSTWHRTSSLMELFKILHQRDPNDPSAKNNLAMMELLLNVQDGNPSGMAQEVYDLSPTNAGYASTYAFSLYLQGKNADGLKVMQQLNLKDRENLSITGYYGLLLKANGNKSEAKEYLNRAFKGNLLPEEQKLFDQAVAGL
jgi:tetratricopeptide (TPR) repeat protein